MQDRRADTYTFTSEKDLIQFFSQALTRTEIQEALRAVRKEFVSRAGAPAPELKLQLLRKCETELVRRVHEKNASQQASRRTP